MIEELLEDTFEGLEDDDLEEEADKEVDKVLFEITNGKRNHSCLQCVHRAYTSEFLVEYCCCLH